MTNRRRILESMLGAVAAGAGVVRGYRGSVSEEAGVFAGSPRVARRRARVRQEPAGALGARVGGLEAGRTYHVAVTTLDGSGQENGGSEREQLKAPHPATP